MRTAALQVVLGERESDPPFEAALDRNGNPVLGLLGPEPQTTSGWWQVSPTLVDYAAGIDELFGFA